MHNIAAKAVALGEALHPSFKMYALQVLKNAKAMEEVFRGAGARLIAGGTDNHLLLVDAETSFGISGAEAEKILDSVGITLNKNVIANDKRKPMDPSGVRFGTPAMTTRGFGEKECSRVAELMIDAIKHRDNKAVLSTVHEEIRTLCARFPIPEMF